MGLIKKIEDLLTWQQARDLNKLVYELTGRKNFIKDNELKKQLRKSSKSIVLNIAEGHGRNTKKEFSRFLFIANGSLSEVQAGLYVALDQGLIDFNDFKEVYGKSESVSNLISGLLKYLNKNN